MKFSLFLLVFCIIMVVHIAQPAPIKEAEVSQTSTAIRSPRTTDPRYIGESTDELDDAEDYFPPSGAKK